ncbi:hypothetical protein INT47_011885 [Mucor saturninus]|uniref:Uncharacterized protein n=1 Tax=Mucor saturninus TaxID=64648 RepID=A0A8H7RCE7_9FUNG|nr:hypothetical protein INT47_011885 [Mucor saturninus]
MAMPNQMYASPIYPSPSVPQMVASPYYNNGMTPAYSMMGPQQSQAGFYPPMASMQMNGQGMQQPVMVQQHYPDYLPGPPRRPCCGDCCCDCSCCNCCLGM